MAEGPNRRIGAIACRELGCGEQELGLGGGQCRLRHAYDPKQKTYFAYGRMGFGRTVAMTYSDDAMHWSEPRRVLACDGQDGARSDVSWDNASLDRLDKRQVRLKFALQKGSLFSYWIGESP